MWFAKLLQQLIYIKRGHLWDLPVWLQKEFWPSALNLRYVPHVGERESVSKTLYSHFYATFNFRFSRPLLRQSTFQTLKCMHLNLLAFQKFFAQGFSSLNIFLQSFSSPKLKFQHALFVLVRPEFSTELPFSAFEDHHSSKKKVYFCTRVTKFLGFAPQICISLISTYFKVQGHLIPRL